MDCPQLAPLTQRLFPPDVKLAERMQLGVRLLEPGGLAAVTPVPQCQAWPAVRDVLLDAVRGKRPTLVYGDYDVDGTFSTALLFRWLRAQGVPGNTFLPSRLIHGYGLDLGIIEQAIKHGYTTLIALDCGTADHAAIELAHGAGLSVAVIDHHQPQGALPVPLLNPHTEDVLPPLCTAGLVALVLAALERELPGSLVGDELELAGLATLADIVPLAPLNWALVHAGLAGLPGTLNRGLRALTVYSGLDGLADITPRQAQFTLIPRLNAAGRLRSARISLDLALAQDEAGARQQAQLLERLNSERQDLSRQIARQAVLAALAESGAAGLALYHPDWHAGVLGIVAAQVAGQLAKPAVILTDAPAAKQGGAGKLLAGSVRSAGGVDIMAALADCGAAVVSFGGHAAAAGVKVLEAGLPEFKAAWAEAVAKQLAAGALALEAVPAVAPVAARLTDLTAQVEDDVWQLQPFGPGFEPAPVVLEGCRVQRASLMGREKTHLALTVGDGAREVRLTGFNLSHLAPQLKTGQAVRPLIALEADNYKNRRTIMLRLLGIER
jgi:single-stranded-DNA-specific exonuclease